MIATKYKTNIFISIIGTIFEFYDFAVYAYLAPIISKLFFPSQSQIVGLISTFAVFATGFLIRPFGSIIFGHIGDKYGRRRALLISIFMMALPTVFIGCLPTYNKIGAFAPVLLVFMRLIQGLSAGGELTGSASYIYEIAPPKKRTFWCSFTASSSMGGVLLGSFTAMLISKILTPAIMSDWGWRVPFLLGFPLAILGIYMRVKINESPLFAKILELKKTYRLPTIEVMKTSLSGFIHTLMITLFTSIAFYLLFVWMPTYLQTFLSKPSVNALFINTITMFEIVVLIPFFALLSERIGRKRLALIGLISLLILVYPLFNLLIYGKPWTIFLVENIFVLCIACIYSVSWISLANFFSTAVRYSGLSMGFNFATSLFGGTTPLICTYLMYKTSILTIPAFYIMIACLLALPSFLAIKEPVAELDESI
jgi:MFS transporter, MHS family, proline/betaine transporter